MPRKLLLYSRQPILTPVTVPLSGSGSVVLPSNYVASLGCRYELIGASSGAEGGSSGGAGGGGVGGGASSWGTDFTPNAGDTISYQIGVHGNGAPFNTAAVPTAATDSWWNSTSIAKAESSKVAGVPTVGAAGLAANSVGDHVTSGTAGTAGNTGGTGRGGSGGAAASTPSLTGGVGGTPGIGTVAGQNGSLQGGGQGGIPGGGPGGGRQLTGGAGADGRDGAGQVTYTVAT